MEFKFRISSFYKNSPQLFEYKNIGYSEVTEQTFVLRIG